MEPLWAAVASAGVVLVVIILWKMVKLAFKIGLIVVAALALVYFARQAGWI